MARTTEEWRRTLYVTLTLLGWLVITLVVFWLLGHVVKTILTVVFAGIVAFALTPLVRLLEKWLPRGVAVGVAYLVGLIVVAGLLSYVVVTATDQVANLVHELPKYQRQGKSLQPRILSVLGNFGVTKAQFRQGERDLVNALKSAGESAASDSLGVATGVAAALIDLVLVLILSVYFTFGGHRLVELLHRNAVGRYRKPVRIVISIFDQVAGGYVRGTLIMASLIGVLVGGGAAVMGVRYPVLLGVIAFFMEFIPTIGALLSGVLTVSVALFQGWTLALIVLAYFVIIHVIEADLVGPRVMGKALGIHPATAIIALVAGTELFGFWGALFGAPIAGLVQAIVTAGWREWHLADA